MLRIAITKILEGNLGKFELNIQQEIVENSFTGIFGSSGCGKTTLLRMIAGLEKPDTGEIVVNDQIWFSDTQKINLSPQQRKLGFVFQENTLFPHLSVLENLSFALLSNQNAAELDTVIENFELKALLQRKPKRLSGGQKQRVALARTLVQKPKLLLLDEPLSALDYTMRKLMQKHILAAHHTYGLTTIIASHDPNELGFLSQNVWKIEGGTIVQNGATKEVLSGL